jgi:FkbM family methyltransferase
VPLSSSTSVIDPGLYASAETATDLAQELEWILSERVLDRYSSAGASGIPTFGSAERPIVIFGAGQLGRTILNSLRRSGIEAIAFADNNSSLWTKRVEGLEVLSPGDAVERYGATATFVIAIWHPNGTSIVRSVSGQLADLGCRGVATFPVVLWTAGQESLPYYLWDVPGKLVPEADRIKAAFHLMADASSRAEFVKQIRLRALADFQSLSTPCNDVQYFPHKMFRIMPNECFIDCGAYTGDSISDFLAYTGNRFKKIIAFEADPTNAAALREYVACSPTLLGEVTVHNSAVAANEGVMAFNANGLPSASRSSAGGSEISCVRLDGELLHESPTFIKMDIEGSELEALQGARETIRKHRPVLAICVYHKQDHLWQIPLAIDDLLPDSSIYLRAHRADGFDVVCYAVPAERRLG